MEKCPFCKSPVAEDLVRFGGSCPHCFIEIPGEEAPTNPGVQPETTAAVAEASGKKGKGIGLILALIALLGVGGAAMVMMNRGGDETLAQDDDDAEFFIVPSSEIPEGELPDEEDPQDAVAQVDPQNTAYTGNGSTYTPPPTQEPQRSAEDPVQPEPVQSNLAPTLGANDDPQVMPSFGATALSDPEMIRSMVQGVIGRYKGQMKRCYEQQLKNNEGLTGTWYLSFTIQTSGKVSAVSSVGKFGANAELEACMVRNASAWSFQPVSEPQYIQQYPFRFGA